jgi:hypothetical protein
MQEQNSLFVAKKWHNVCMKTKERGTVTTEKAEKAETQ